VDLPLARAALDRGLPNFMRANGARIFGYCWENRGGAKVRVNIAACK